METYNEETLQYLSAKEQVKRIKGFYSHLTVYLIVNAILIYINIYYDHEAWNSWENYFSTLVWGVGLSIHGCVVFFPNIILGKKWEERKIKELMNKELKK